MEDYTPTQIKTVLIGTIITFFGTMICYPRIRKATQSLKRVFSLDYCHAHPLTVAASLIGVLFVVWIGFSALFSRIDEFKWLESTFGELDHLEGIFASSASFFTVITFAVIIITLIQQQKGISNNTQGYKIASFESIFFQLIGIHSTNQNEFDLGIKNGSKKQFYDLYRIMLMAYYYQSIDLDRLSKNIKNHKTAQLEIRRSGPTQRASRNPKHYLHYYSIAVYIQDARKSGQFKPMLFFDAIQDAYGEHITKYYRHFYHMLKHIKKAKEDNIIEDVTHYCNILKAQLSPIEQVLLYYNALYFETMKDKPNYKQLLTEFSLFDDLNKELLICSGQVGKYPQAAFGDDHEQFCEYIEG